MRPQFERRIGQLGMALELQGVRPEDKAIEIYSGIYIGSTEPLSAAAEPNINPASVSEWNSILNFLFQTEPPPEETPETEHPEAAEPSARNIATTETMPLWINTVPPCPLPPLPTSATMPYPVPSGTHSPEYSPREISSEETVGDEPLQLTDRIPEPSALSTLPETNWTLSPSATTIIRQSKPEKPTPAFGSPARQSNSGETSLSVVRFGPVLTPPRGLWPREPAAIEATFRIDSGTAASDAGAALLPESNSTSAVIDASDPVTRESWPQGKQGASVFMRHQPNRDSPPQVELRGHDGDSAGQGSKSANEPMEHAPSDFQLNPTEREPFPVLGGVLHESGRIARMPPNLTSPQSAQETIAVIADELGASRRSGAIQLDLLVSSEDIGGPISNKDGAIRLHLQQRGDEVLMKVLGGGQQLALRAEPEWDSLVERLKLHGLEPTGRSFAVESSRRDGEAIPVHNDGQTTTDTGSNSQDEAKRFGQEQQQQHQQRQPRYRYPARSSRRPSAFSLDGEPTGEQST